MLRSSLPRCLGCLCTTFVLTGLVLTVGCGYSGSNPYGDPPPEPNVISLNPQEWNILYSPDMPLHPAPDPEGAWSFEFPLRVDGSVHYVAVPFKGTIPLHEVTITFKVESKSAQYAVMDPSDHPPATFHLFFEENNEIGNLNDRWWADYGGYNLGSQDGQVLIISVPLKSADWSNMYGQHDPVAFSAALAHVGTFGLTFGGQYYWGHGAAVSSGSAKFILINYGVD